MKDFLSKCDQIRSFLKIWLHILMKSFMEKLIFSKSQFLIYIRFFIEETVSQFDLNFVLKCRWK